MATSEVVPQIEQESPIRRSPSIAKLVEAKAKASTEFAEIAKDTENPFYKSTYADLATLIKATRSVLGKNGLDVSQFPLTNGSRAGVTTLLAHSSGEWIESDLTLPVTKQDAQGTGSAITYARRYAYQSVLNIAGEEDDDGNAAVGKTKKAVLDKITEYENNFDQREEAQQTIAPAVQEGIRSFCKTHGRTDDQLLAWMKVNLKVDRIDKVRKIDLELLKNWIMGKEPIQQTLLASVQSAPGRSVVSKGPTISEAQLKRLFAIKNSHSVSDQDLKQYVSELGGPEHLKDLTKPVYDQVCGWLESVQP
jgi:hypothetical protein